MCAALHDMRAPLTAVAGFAKLMLEDEGTDVTARQEYLTNIAKQCQNLTRLLANLVPKSGTVIARPVAEPPA